MKGKLWIAIPASMALLAGCSSQTDMPDISALQTDGAFQYPGLPFSSTYEEAVKEISLEFISMTAENPESNYQVYYSENFVPFYQQEAQVWLEFLDGGLETVKIQFRLPDGREAFDQLLEDLTAEYGEAERRDSENSRFTTESYQWEKDQTYLNAMLLEDDKATTGTLAVFRMTE